MFANASSSVVSDNSLFKIVRVTSSKGLAASVKAPVGVKMSITIVSSVSSPGAFKSSSIPVISKVPSRSPAKIIISGEVL